MSQDIFVVVEHLQGQVSDITYVMLAAGRVLADDVGGELIGVLLAHDGQALADTLAADRVIYVDHPLLSEFTSDVYQKVIAVLIKHNAPRAVLFGNTSIGSDVASYLSGLLSLPMVGFCQSFAAGEKYVSKMYGGKILAEGSLPGPTTLVGMIPGGYRPEQGTSEQPPEIVDVPPSPIEDIRVRLTGYVEPEVGDVDIATQPILIAVGRGVQNQDNIEIAEEFAEMIGGTVSCSRPIVDQGWLPASRMVGKSGKTVKPSLYMAMGISGAPEHVEAITESEMIIAVNTDPAAPIFEIAQYGAEIDMLDLMEALIDQLEETQ